MIDQLQAILVAAAEASALVSQPSYARTRRSLYVPAVYLTVGGLGLLFMPHLALRLFFSNGDYGPTFPRLAGALSLGLAILVVQTIRHHLVALYTTLIWVRVLFCSTYVALYVQTRDPFFLAMLTMVGTGALLTTRSWLADRRDDHAPAT